MIDLEQDTTRAVELCLAAEERLASATVALRDGDVRAPSLLPGWTRGHVLTHLARNADGHARRVEGALRGESLGKYAGGAEQRRAEIEAGVGRPVGQILTDLRSSQDHLRSLVETAAAKGWPHGHLRGGESYPVTSCPAHRLREVEMHHVDLGLSYTPADWPQEYVAWDTISLLPTVHDRLASPEQRRTFMAWLAGRGPVDPQWRLDPWG